MKTKNIFDAIHDLVDSGFTREEAEAQIKSMDKFITTESEQMFNRMSMYITIKLGAIMTAGLTIIGFLVMFKH